MKAKDTKWCPQHGYPLPCAKCGMPLPQLSQKEIYEAGQRAGRKEVVEWTQDNIIGFEMTSVIIDMWESQIKGWSYEKETKDD